MPYTLIIIDYFHNSKNVASRRFRNMLKYMDAPKDVHVITACSSQVKNDGAKIHCVTGAGLIDCKQNYRKLYFALNIILLFFPRIATFIFFNSIWTISALKEVMRIANGNNKKTRRIVLLATFSPLDSLVCAAIAAQHIDADLLLDFRDGLAFEGLSRLSKKQAFLSSVIERRIVSSANGITTVTTPLFDYFAASYPDKNIFLVPNSYDPVLYGREPNISHQVETVTKLTQVKPAGMITISYFGHIGISDDSATPALQSFLEALTLTKWGKVAMLLFVGQLTSQEQNILAQSGVNFQTLPMQPIETAAQLMESSDILLLLTGNRKSVATGKIFDYLGANKPILAVTRVNNEAVSILEATQSGLSLLSSDLEALEKTIDLLMSGNRRVNEKIRLYYSAAYQAKRLRNILNSLVVRSFKKPE